MPLADSRLGLLVSIRDAYNLPVAVTHLTSGGSAVNTRGQQLDRLLGWAKGFGEPRVVMGDFNVGPQGPEMQTVFGQYHDAWTDAVQMGRASGAGASKGALRVDYIFFAPGGAMTLESAEVVDTAALIGVQASDHQPVVAIFSVR